MKIVNMTLSNLAHNDQELLNQKIREIEQNVGSDGHLVLHVIVKDLANEVEPTLDSIEIPQRLKDFASEIWLWCGVWCKPLKTKYSPSNYGDVLRMERLGLVWDESKQKTLDIDEFQKRYSEWAFKTFKGQSVSGKLKHLVEEIETEILPNPSDIKEWGDGLGLYLNAAYMMGFTISDIVSALDHKWKTDLVHREWREPDEEGRIHHVKHHRV